MLDSLPADWRHVELQEVCEILDRLRVPLNSKERAQRQGNIPYWGANGIVDYIDEAIFDEPLLLMPEDGGPFSEARSKPICHKLEGPAWVNNHAHVLRVTGAQREFIYYWFVHRDITPFLKGGGRAKLNQADLRKLPVVLPPLAEQMRIAEVLDSVDDSIRATEAVIEQAERVKRGLMEDLLTGGLGSEAIALGNAPDGWKVQSIEAWGIDLIDGDRGKEYPKTKDFAGSGHCLFLNAKNVTKAGWRFDELNFISEDRHKRLRKGTLERGDIVITTRGTIGNIAYYDDAVPFDVCRINSGMAIFRNTVGEILTPFLKAQLEAVPIQKQIEKLTYGSAQPALTIKTLKSLQLAVPPLKDQRQIVSALEAAGESVGANWKTLFQLQRLKRGLMDDLLTGRVRTVS